MQRKLIFILVFMVLVAIFALQNYMEVEIRLWFWSVRTSMALILILTFSAGALAGILFSIPKRSKRINNKDSRGGSPGIETRVHENQAGDQISEQDDPIETDARKDMDEFEDIGN